MKLRWIIFWILLVAVGAVQAQKVEVPPSIRFADMQLDLSPAARKKIQTDVDALLRSEKYFLLKLEKVDAHFPLIEQVLKEENVPDDMKYLVIQESALVGDAISTSNAIGYWQFKEPAAREVGLSINHAVDERMNIITATRGAAKYLKSNNTFFDNWLYALMAYNTGPGGALKLVDKSQYGKKRMRLEGHTHWYVLKFLAHKIAFENAVGKNPYPKVQLFAYADGKGKTLREIAQEFELEEADLEPYNRWLKAKRIPDDKAYFAIIPSFEGKPEEGLLAHTKTEPEPAKQEERKAREDLQAGNSSELTPVADTRRFPVIQTFNRRGAEVKINGIPGIIAREGDNIRTISERTGVSTSRIVAFNDLTSKKSAIIPGKHYYIRNKRNRGASRYHIAEPGETLWSVSQRFGMKLKKLIRNNRMKEEEEVKPGRVLWLRYIRPVSFPIEYRDVETPQQKAMDEVASSIPVMERMDPAEISHSNGNAQEKNLVTIVTDKSGREKPEDNFEKPVNPESYESWESESQEDISEPSQTSTFPSLPPAETPTGSTAATEEEDFGSSEVVFTAPVPASENHLPDYHTVQRGETLYSIARQYQLTIPQLQRFNHLTAETTLKTGQKLLLRPTESVEISQQNTAGINAYIYHEVQPGETLYRVARSYDVTIKELMEWNEKDNFNVSVGERLKIARPQ